MDKRDMKLIYIEWADSVSSGSQWYSKEELKDWDTDDFWIVKQVGFVIKETKEFILLCSQYRPPNHFVTDGDYGHLQKIPKTWIRKRKILTT